MNMLERFMRFLAERDPADISPEMIAQLRTMQAEQKDRRKGDRHDGR